MEIRNPSMTARDAANEFARTAFGEPRKVGEYQPLGNQNGKHYADFRLVGGVRWYSVSVLDDYSGWRIDISETADA